MQRGMTTIADVGSALTRISVRCGERVQSVKWNKKESKLLLDYLPKGAKKIQKIEFTTLGQVDEWLDAVPREG